MTYQLPNFDMDFAEFEHNSAEPVILSMIPILNLHDVYPKFPRPCLHGQFYWYFDTVHGLIELVNDPEVLKILNKNSILVQFPIDEDTFARIKLRADDCLHDFVLAFADGIIVKESLLLAVSKKLKQKTYGEINHTNVKMQFLRAEAKTQKINRKLKLSNIKVQFLTALLHMRQADEAAANEYWSDIDDSDSDAIQRQLEILASEETSLLIINKDCQQISESC